MPVEAMRHQCEAGHRVFTQGRIDGMIFLASCICDLGIETVEWTRKWIQTGRQRAQLAAVMALLKRPNWIRRDGPKNGSERMEDDMSNGTSQKILKALRDTQPLFSAGRLLGANDRIGIGVIGTGGRGTYLIEEVLKVGNTSVLAVCDVYDVRRDKAAEKAGPSAKRYSDHRQLLEQKEIDAVMVDCGAMACPATVDACQQAAVYEETDDALSGRRPGDPESGARRKPDCAGRNAQPQRAAAISGSSEEKIIDAGLVGKVGLVRTWVWTRSLPLEGASGHGEEAARAGLGTLARPVEEDSWDPERYFVPYKWWDVGGGMLPGVFVHVLDTTQHYLDLKNHWRRSPVAGSIITTTAATLRTSSTSSSNTREAQRNLRGGSPSPCTPARLRSFTAPAGS